LQRISDGDDDALRDLYRQNQRLAFALAVRILGREDAAEDIVQEAFLRVWRNATRFDPAKAGFTTWLGRIVRNLCIDQLRRKSPLSRGDAVGEVERWLAPVPTVDNEVLDRLVVREAFLQLPREQSQVLNLSYFEGLTHREIARTLAIPEGTVKSRMRLGLRKMRTYLDDGAAATEGVS
jgi:RNA polymerase sigma-70 factor (ECF subfamily)